MNNYFCFITSICIVNMAWLGLYAQDRKFNYCMLIMAMLYRILIILLQSSAHCTVSAKGASGWSQKTT